MYRLTRDDGAVLSVSGNMWEDALELAYLHGWKPAGTEAPRTESFRGRSTQSWDRLDYFSHDSQHVASDDARALAGAVRRALARVRRSTAPAGGRIAPDALPANPPEAEGRSRLTKRNALHRLVAFAHRGGFTIGRPI